MGHSKGTPEGLMVPGGHLPPLTEAPLFTKPFPGLLLPGVMGEAALEFGGRGSIRVW